MTADQGGESDDWPPSLAGRYSQSEITTDLSQCGLQTERTQKIAELYAEEFDWTEVKNQWYSERMSNRSSQDSSRKIFSPIKSRLQSVTGGLPTVPLLPSILEQCRNERDRAQIVYFYFLEYDNLAKYVVHEYIREMLFEGSTEFDFDYDTALGILSRFQYRNGERLSRSESTQRRWASGLRSVLREIGVIDGKTSTTGQIPKVGDIPLQVAAYYSWSQNGDEWLTKPIGWLYLFQSEDYWEPQSNRLARYDGWTHHEARNRVWFEPVDDYYEQLAEGAV